MDTRQTRLFIRKWSRTLHIYISMLGLLVLVFFSVTGLMLNHEEWFGYAEPVITTRNGVIDRGLLQEPDKLAIVELLRKDFGATGAMDSFESDDEEFRVVFSSPGRRSQAVISREDGQAEVENESHGFSGRLVELHRGVDAGPAWRLIIDASAILFLIIGLTGLTLWMFVPKWRPMGLLAVASSVAICTVVYLVLVP